MKHARFVLLAVVLLLITATIWNGCETAPPVSSTAPQDEPLASVQSSPQMQEARPLFVAGEALVKFSAGATEDQRSAALQRVSGIVGERILTRAMQARGDNEGLTLVRTPMTVGAAAASLRGAAGVEYAEPNYYYYHDASSNDPYYTNGSLWGMYGDATSPANQYGSQAGEAWAAGNTGSGSVVIGIIDEGAKYTHEDLAANFWTNPFDPVDGVDNDGNGYVDDTHGWDFDGNNNSTFDGTQDDHGTHVAGTIGAVGGNGVGVTGVNWSVTLISAKFLGRRGGTTANAIKAVYYVTDLKTRHGLNIVATNNSWGGGGFSQGLQDAIGRANTANILFIAAAGNSGANNDTTASYPSNYPNANIIAVAALASSGALASYSQYGAVTVDIGAPGSGVYSTVPARSGKNLVSGYASYSGTSMAAPHVTGAAALYASSHAGASAADIKAAILGSAVPTPSLSGKVA